MTSRRGTCGLLALALITGLGSGCASTRISGQRQAGFQDTSYGSFLVFCNAQDDQLRGAIESATVRRLEGRGIRAMRSLDLLDEPREYGETEVLARMKDAGLDGLARLELRDLGVDVVEHPGHVSWYVTGCGFVSHWSPPWRDERSRIVFDLDLLDRASGRVAWTGLARLSLAGERGVDDLADHVAMDLVDYFRRQGLAPAES